MIGLLTTDEVALRGRDHDTPRLADALRRDGHQVDAPIWHDDAVDWAKYELLVIRTPWDYSERHAEFMAWLDRASARTRILNAPDLIRWNIDKRYLVDLQECGVPAIATMFCDDVAEAEKAIAQVVGSRLVVKPSVSAGSRDTGLFAPGDPGALALAEHIIANGKTAMVQPAAESVIEAGENALFFFNGRYSHAFHKGPILAPGGGYRGGVYRPEITRANPSLAEVALGEQVIAAIDRIAAELPLYARIDIAATEGENPQLLEAELFEPALFIDVVPEAVPNFVAAVAARLSD